MILKQKKIWTKKEKNLLLNKITKFQLLLCFVGISDYPWNKMQAGLNLGPLLVGLRRIWQLKIDNADNLWKITSNSKGKS